MKTVWLQLLTLLCSALLGCIGGGMDGRPRP
jgi:hypothetical protein